MEMANKLRFYDQYSVEEYYLYDLRAESSGNLAAAGGIPEKISHLKGWVSPRLGIRLTLTPGTLQIHAPDGRPFLNSVELARWATSAEVRAEQEAKCAAEERSRAEDWPNACAPWANQGGRVKGDWTF